MEITHRQTDILRTERAAFERPGAQAKEAPLPYGRGQVIASDGVDQRRQISAPSALTRTRGPVTACNRSRGRSSRGFTEAVAPASSGENCADDQREPVEQLAAPFIGNRVEQSLDGVAVQLLDVLAAQDVAEFLVAELPAPLRR